jgi:heptosyltransferase II
LSAGKTRKKILVLRYRFIGDTILTVPFLRNLRRAEPDALIVWVVAPGSSDVVRLIPYVDELLYWDPVTIHADSRGAHRTLRAKIAFIRDLRSRSFDKVYVLKRSFSSAIMAALTGAPERIGFDTENRAFLLTKTLPYRPQQHEVLSFLDVLRADGVPVIDDYLESWLSGDEMKAARDILFSAGWNEGKPLLAIHPFGSIEEKTWPIERFAEVAATAVARFGFTTVLLGGPGDREFFARHSRLFPAGSIDCVGRCGVRVSMAILKLSAFFLGNDSGVMHLAAAAGIPVLGLFGPTSPTRFGPWGEKSRVIYGKFPCSPCRQKYFTECAPAESGKPACIDSIGVSDVLAEMESMVTSIAVREA